MTDNDKLIFDENFSGIWWGVLYKNSKCELDFHIIWIIDDNWWGMKNEKKLKESVYKAQESLFKDFTRKLLDCDMTKWQCILES
jgi:hypothetical protein